MNQLLKHAVKALYLLSFSFVMTSCAKDIEVDDCQAYEWKYDGKEYTYYHFTHSGDIETERTPDFRRMERMPFPKPMIDNSNHNDVRVWRVKRGSKDRILIFSESAQYLVVLEDRGDYILPWTGYYIEYSNKIRRLIKEYEAYKKPKPLG